MNNKYGFSKVFLGIMIHEDSSRNFEKIVVLVKADTKEGALQRLREDDPLWNKLLLDNLVELIDGQTRNETFNVYIKTMSKEISLDK